MNLKRIASILTLVIGVLLTIYGVYNYFIEPKKHIHQDNTSTPIDVEAIVLYQIKTFEGKNLKCLKISTFNGSQDSVVIEKPDWKKELAPFEAIYLNKSNLKGAFVHKNSFRGGKIVDYYKKNKDAKTDIEFVQVFTSLTGKMYAIQSKILVQNLIYGSAKNYELYFDTVSTQNLSLKSFVIQGQQGFLNGQPDKYRAEFIIY